MITTIDTNIKNLGDGKGDFIRSVLTNNGEHTAVESPHFETTDKDAFRAALNIHYQNLVWTLRQRQFPEHTMIADAHVQEDGSLVYTNLRYIRTKNLLWQPQKKNK